MDAATHVARVPFQRRHAFASRDVPHLERLVVRPRNDAAPVRKYRNATDGVRVPFKRRHTFASHDVPHLERVVPRHRKDTPLVRRYSNAIDVARVPFQCCDAFTSCRVPHLERLVPRPRHHAPPVRKHGNARDLRRSQIITKVQRTPQRTIDECPFSVATHSPVATSQTLSVLSHDADTTRRPSGDMATP